MTQDDLPPVGQRPRVGFTWWWVIALAVAAGAGWAFTMQDHPKHDAPGMNTVELSRSPTG